MSHKTTSPRSRHRSVSLRPGGHTAASINNVRLAISAVERQLYELRNEQRQRDLMLTAIMEQIHAEWPAHRQALILQTSQSLEHQHQQVDDVLRQLISRLDQLTKDVDHIFIIVGQFPEAHRRMQDTIRELQCVLLSRTALQERAIGQPAHPNRTPSLATLDEAA